MRLICPNCGAQYEVDDNVIPEAGRDVQCSNCGHTWYQKPNSRQTSQPVAPAPMTDPAEAAPKDEFGRSPVPHGPDESETQDPPSADAAPDPAQAAEPEPPAPRETGIPSSVTPEVSDILREEAALEETQRQSETPALESQPDLGLDASPEETPPNISERMARLRGEEDELASTVPAAAAASAAAIGHRKDLLPDIEEINSSLTPADTEHSAQGETGDAAIEARRGGFRRGFAMVIIVFGVMLLIYLYAPKIVEFNPQTEPALSAYVDWVNNLRTSLDSFMADAATRLTKLLAGLNGEG